MVITTKHNTEGLSTYLWGSFDTGSMYTHSLLLKVLSIQGFLDCERREKATRRERQTAADLIWSDIFNADSGRFYNLQHTSKFKSQEKNVLLNDNISEEMQPPMPPCYYQQ